MTKHRFDEIAVGQEHRSSHRISGSEIDAFAQLSGDYNALHVNGQFARQFGFAGRVAHGALTSAFLSKVLGTEFPGNGVLWLSQSLRFLEPVYEDELVEFVVRVTHRSEGFKTLGLDIEVRKGAGVKVVVGQAKVMMLEQHRQVSWEESVAIVTGASRGIGAGVAKALAAKGARIVINYRSNESAAQAVRQEILDAGGAAIVMAADVTTEDGVGRLTRAALTEYGAVHILVNNATPAIQTTPLAELTWAQMQLFLEAYLKSAFLLVQALRPAFCRQGYGRVINVLTSYVLGMPPSGMASYVTAKAALAGLAKCLAVELAPEGVTVNNVLPSPVSTGQWAGAPESRRRALALKNPLKRLALAEDVANAVTVLASPESAFITGASLPVTGGESF